MATKYVWMEVTVDKYELPLAVADNPVALARLIGERSTSIREAWSRYKRGTNKTCRYRRVALTEEDE